MKKDTYDDKADITPEHPMIFTLNKQSFIIKQNKWNDKSAGEEQINTISSELQKFRGINIKFSASINNKAKAKGYNNNKYKGKVKGNYKGKNSPHQKSYDKHAWEKIAPEDGKPVARQHNENT